MVWVSERTEALGVLSFFAGLRLWPKGNGQKTVQHRLFQVRQVGQIGRHFFTCGILVVTIATGEFLLRISLRRASVGLSKLELVRSPDCQQQYCPR